MEKLNLKPTHKPIQDYYDALKQYEQHDLTHEGTVSNPFAILLDLCAKRVNATFAPKYPMRSTMEKNIFIDGAILEGYRLPSAYWEAKDMDDNLQKAIQEKRDKGYPFDNILFQTPERAILYQNGEEVLDTDITDPVNLVEALQRLFSYSNTTFKDWYDAVNKFSDRIPTLADKLKELVKKQQKTNEAFKKAFASFYQTCLTSINPDLSQAAVEEMLIQHILTERIFRTVFDRSDFTSRNIIAIEIEKVSAALMQHSVSRDEFLKPLNPFYDAIEDAATHCKDFSEKQNFLNTVYERFFQGFSEDVADTHGIVYTPQPIVDFMVNSVAHILETEFGRSLSDTGVHIIDPFVGTGNFIVRLMQDIPGTALESKYRNELHCNEVMLLPYYIASLNIEQEYLQRIGTYLRFEGIALADTFELFEGQQQHIMFTQENTERVERQKASDMFVVIGNPPYNIGQKNENDNNKNRKYPEGIDKRISETYAKGSDAELNKGVYDSYVRAIRWASDRIGEEGVIAFITNNGFLRGISFDAMRKHLVEDFDSIYILDLDGDAGEAVEVSDASVFGIQIGVSINLFVKTKQNPSSFAHILYHQIDELWNKERKFNFLNEHRHIGTVKRKWQTIQPDSRHTWLTEGLYAEFDDFIPMGTKKAKATKGDATDTIFKIYSLGVSTNRDAWVCNFNRNALTDNMHKMIETYNDQVFKWERRLDRDAEVDDFVISDDKKIKWSRNLKRELKRIKIAEYDENKVRNLLYRPFTKRHLFFDRIMNDEVSHFPSLFPTPETENENRAICVSGRGHDIFRCQIANGILELKYSNSFNGGTQCFPFYTYNENGTNRQENITDWALLEFRTHYGDDIITKWDIFHYTYGLLHHPAYREKYQMNLKRDLPHIPFAKDFWGFANAGAALADLHVNYESAPKYDRLKKIETEGMTVDWRVEKMRLSKDKTQLKYNDFLTLDGIPAEVYDYRLGNRSALEWVVNQYRVSEDYKKKTGRGSRIVNDPNREEDPQYILDLIERVITVSLETVKIINNLPTLRL